MRPEQKKSNRRAPEASLGAAVSGSRWSRVRLVNGLRAPKSDRPRFGNAESERTPERPLCQRRVPQTSDPPRVAGGRVRPVGPEFSFAVVAVGTFGLVRKSPSVVRSRNREFGDFDAEAEWPRPRATGRHGTPRDPRDAGPGLRVHSIPRTSGSLGTPGSLGTRGTPVHSGPRGRGRRAKPGRPSFSCAGVRKTHTELDWQEASRRRESARRCAAPRSAQESRNGR